MNNTWLVVADGARASIYDQPRPNDTLKPVSDGVLKHINKPSRELVTTKRGRVFHSADGTRSAMERPTDPHAYEKWRFAIKLSAYLHARNHKFAKLVLIAPPKMLGNLRQNLSRQNTNKVSAELAKDLTKVPAHELPKHLSDVM